jgi:hypothetical protein
MRFWIWDCGLGIYPISDRGFLIGVLFILFRAKKAKRQNLRSAGWKSHSARPRLTATDLESGPQPYLNPESAIEGLWTKVLRRVNMQQMKMDRGSIFVTVQGFKVQRFRVQS